MSGFGSFISGALDSASADRKAAQEEQRQAERRYADAEFTKKLELELQNMRPVGFKDLGNGTKAAVNAKGEVIGPPVALSEKEQLTGKLELLTTNNALEDASPARREEKRAAEKAESESVIGARKAQAASSYASANESATRARLGALQVDQAETEIKRHRFDNVESSVATGTGANRVVTDTTRAKPITDKDAKSRQERITQLDTQLSLTPEEQVMLQRIASMAKDSADWEASLNQFLAARTTK